MTPELQNFIKENPHQDSRFFTIFLQEHNHQSSQLIAKLSKIILDNRTDSTRAYDKCLAFLFSIVESDFSDQLDEFKTIMVNPPAIMEAALHLSISQNKQFSPKMISSIFIDTFLSTMPEALADYETAFGE